MHEAVVDFCDDGCLFYIVDPNTKFKAQDFGSIPSHILKMNVQDIQPSAVSNELKAGDILFIDTSHCSRTGGDVNTIYLDIIPRLRPGVLIHVHDIFFPFDYPKEWVMDKSRSWNEQYMLQALLQNNSKIKVLWAEHYMRTMYPALWSSVFGEIIDSFDLNYYSNSIWLKTL
jgi:hypothetical protein